MDQIQSIAPPPLDSRREDDEHEAFPAIASATDFHLYHRSPNQFTGGHQFFSIMPKIDLTYLRKFSRQLEWSRRESSLITTTRRSISAMKKAGTTNMNRDDILPKPLSSNSSIRREKILGYRETPTTSASSLRRRPSTLLDRQQLSYLAMKLKVAKPFLTPTRTT